MSDTSATPDINTTTQQALHSELLAPRFYRTDYKALDRLDISPVREQWDAMMTEFEQDRNRGHFRSEIEFDPTELQGRPALMGR